MRSNWMASHMDAFFGDQPLQPFGLQRLGIDDRKTVHLQCALLRCRACGSGIRPTLSARTDPPTVSNRLPEGSEVSPYREGLAQRTPSAPAVEGPAVEDSPVRSRGDIGPHGYPASPGEHQR